VNPWPTSESRLEKGTASRPLQLCVAMKVLPLWSICSESDAIEEGKYGDCEGAQMLESAEERRGPAAVNGYE